MVECAHVSTDIRVGLCHLVGHRRFPAILTTGIRDFAEVKARRKVTLRGPRLRVAKLLRIVLSNCAIDAASVYPTYTKPFDMIFARAKNEEWRA